ncbi:MinD/ParA family ATP-binding protein [Naumannella huperziae]
MTQPNQPNSPWPQTPWGDDGPAAGRRALQDPAQPPRPDDQPRSQDTPSRAPEDRSPRSHAWPPGPQQQPQQPAPPRQGASWQPGPQQPRHVAPGPVPHRQPSPPDPSPTPSPRHGFDQAPTTPVGEPDPPPPSPFGPPSRQPQRPTAEPAARRGLFDRIADAFGGGRRRREEEEAQARALADQRAAEQRRREAEAAAAREERRRVIDTPVDHHLITVSSLKGGITKTTIVLAIGTALALHRRDLVLAIDGNAHRGTLARRLGEETGLTVRDLVADAEDVRTAKDFRRFTSQAASRFEVLASEPNPAEAQGFSAEEYATVLDIAKTFRSVIMTDTGTDLTLPLMSEVYGNTDTLVVPATTAHDGADLAWETLDWWEEHADPALVRNAIVAITQIEPFSLPPAEQMPAERIAELRAAFIRRQRQREAELTERFAGRVGEVIFVPYDPSLHVGGLFAWDRLSPETAAAYEDLAYAVARRFAARD